MVALPYVHFVVEDAYHAYPYPDHCLLDPSPNSVNPAAPNVVHQTLDHEMVPNLEVGPGYFVEEAAFLLG